MEWKKVFRKDIKIKLKESKIEFDKYKSTSSIIYLQQSCNKLFSVVENWLMLKYDNRVKSYKDLYFLIRDNKHDRRLLRNANQLHRFFYNGELQMERFEASELYLDVYNIIINRINRGIN